MTVDNEDTLHILSGTFHLCVLLKSEDWFHFCSTLSTFDILLWFRYSLSFYTYSSHLATFAIQESEERGTNEENEECTKDESHRKSCISDREVGYKNYEEWKQDIENPVCQKAIWLTDWWGFLASFMIAFLIFSRFNGLET